MNEYEKAIQIVRRYKNIIIPISAINNLPHTLISSFIMTESNGYEVAMRFEKGYRWTKLYEQAKSMDMNDETEIQLQKFSYGLMQIMGATARWRGFTGHLMNLLDPQTNIEIGCEYLNYLQKAYQDRSDDFISAYNMGRPIYLTRANQYSNQYYVDKIKRLEKLFEEIKGE